jgi:hypothetical protein
MTIRTAIRAAMLAALMLVSQPTMASKGMPQGVNTTLAAKARQIIKACGSRVISGRRNTFIARTRKRSLHASGQAVDMAGNPKCMYRMLKGWQGGYTIDYGAVKHIHISIGGNEVGKRFRHHKGKQK